MFVGTHLVPPALVVRASARANRDELRRTGASAAEVEQAERRMRRSTLLAVAGAAFFAAGLPMFIIGVVRQEKGGNKTRVYTRRRGRHVRPRLAVGPYEATAGVRVRF